MRRQILTIVAVFLICIVFYKLSGGNVLQNSIAGFAGVLTIIFGGLLLTQPLVKSPFRK